LGAKVRILFFDDNFNFEVQKEKMSLVLIDFQY